MLEAGSPWHDVSSRLRAAAHRASRWAVRSWSLTHQQQTQWYSFLLSATEHPLPAILLGMALCVGAVPVLKSSSGPAEWLDQSAQLIYLIPVVLASTLGGWWAGVSVALIAVSVWNWFFLPHAGIGLRSPADAVTLVVFLAVAAVVAQLSTATRHRFQAARQHEIELEAEVAKRTREIERTSRELTTRILQAQEQERQRISRELHDETAQSLSTLLINLDFIESHSSGDAAALTEGLDRVRIIAQRTLGEVRALAHALRPSTLDDLGLVAALRWCAREHTATFGVPVQVKAAQIPVGRLAPEVELTIFRMAQEALMNSGKHAQAQHVSLILSFPANSVQLVVEDDGKGFDPDHLHGPTRRGGLGLHGMQERADLIGATVEVSSKRGAGTRIVVTAPLWVVESEPARSDA